MKAMLPLLAVLATTALATPPRFAVDAALLGASGGGYTLRYANRQYFMPNFEAQFLRVAVGAELSDHIGAAVGTSYGEARYYENSFFPITARLWWDFDSEQLWRRRTAYAFATYHYHAVSWASDPEPPHVQLGVGVTYTFYAITPKAELWTRPCIGKGWDAALMVGFDIGGTYVFGRGEAGK